MSCAQGRYDPAVAVPNGLLTAGAVVGLVGGTIGAVAGGFVAVRAVRKSRGIREAVLTTRRNAARTNYAGMTTNERLFVAGLLDEWGAAIEAHDRQVAIEVLGRVALADQAASIVDTTLANPAMYGFPRL